MLSSPTMYWGVQSAWYDHAADKTELGRCCQSGYLDGQIRDQGATEGVGDPIQSTLNKLKILQIYKLLGNWTEFKIVTASKRVAELENNLKGRFFGKSLKYFYLQE